MSQSTNPPIGLGYKIFGSPKSGLGWVDLFLAQPVGLTLTSLVNLINLLKVY